MLVIFLVNSTWDIPGTFVCAFTALVDHDADNKLSTKAVIARQETISGGHFLW